MHFVRKLYSTLVLLPLRNYVVLQYMHVGGGGGDTASSDGLRNLTGIIFTPESTTATKTD
jgi:hypothetical protein